MQQETYIPREREDLSIVDILSLDIPVGPRFFALWRSSTVTKDQKAALLNKITTRSIKKYALNCKIGSVENWAKDWISGRDRTKRAALEASETAGAAGHYAAKRAGLAAARAAMDDWSAMWEAGQATLEAAREIFRSGSPHSEREPPEDVKRAREARMVELHQQISDAISICQTDSSSA